ncbi:type VI secretion system membrane subunit TssM, partial [Klebsiella pneumoniae]|nr:type VI secretion system membrane subunit TssM [Klebsiella pneumoniae]
MFGLPSSRLLIGLKADLRPAMPRFKVSAFWLLILAWIFLLVGICGKGPMWRLNEEKWRKPLGNHGLAKTGGGV